MSDQDGGKSVGSAGPYSIARVESKLTSIQERIALLQASLNDCRSPEQRQYLQAELAFVKTRQMVCQKHKGMLLQGMQHYTPSKTESRSTYSYSDYLISGALKLFQRWTQSSTETESGRTAAADPERAALDGTDTVEGQSRPAPSAAEHAATLRKRKPSSTTA